MDIEVSFGEWEVGKFSGGWVVGEEESFDDSEVEVGRDFQGDRYSFEGSSVVMDTGFAVGNSEHSVVFGALQEGA